MPGAWVDLDPDEMFEVLDTGDGPFAQRSGTGWNAVNGVTAIDIALPAPEIDPAHEYEVEITWTGTGTNAWNTAGAYGRVIGISTIASPQDAYDSSWYDLWDGFGLGPYDEVMTVTIGPGIAEWDAGVGDTPPTAFLMIETPVRSGFSSVRYRDMDVDEPSADLGDDGIEFEDVVSPASWEPPVVGRPASVSQPQLEVVARAVTTAVTINAAGMPVVVKTDEHKTRLRLRVLVGGKDVTYYRGHATVLGNVRLVQPLWYGSGDLTFPGVSYYEQTGTGSLSWLAKDKRVVLQLVDDDDEVVTTFYVGLVRALTPTTDGHWSADLGGEATERLSLLYVPSPKFRKNRDVLTRCANDLTSVGLPVSPRRPFSGIEVSSRGGVFGLDHFAEHMTLAVTNGGVQWTCRPDALLKAYTFEQKDRETIDATCYQDSDLVVFDVRTDLVDDVNRSFATGVTEAGERIGFIAAPGIIQGEVPAFPGTLEEGDDNEDVTVLLWQLTFTGYLNLDDHGDGFDQDVVDAVEELQEDAGLTVTGVVNEATWNALWDLESTHKGVNFIHEVPAARRSFTEKWLRSASGAILGRNPDYRPERTKVDVANDMGRGTRRQIKRWARNELAPLNEDHWTGTIRFESGLIVGEHNPGDAFTEADIMDAIDLRPGMNIWAPLHDGGTLFHVSGVDIKGDPEKGFTVEAIVDTKARDTMKAWEVHERNVESRHNPARAWSGRVRQSQINNDVTTEWLDFCGKVTRAVDLPSGDWSEAIPIFSGQEGFISRIRDELDAAREHAVIITSKPMSDIRINNLVPNPLADPGDESPWYEQDAVRTFLESKGLVYAAGTFKEPCGYGYARKHNDAGVATGEPLTGVHMDDGGWNYRTLAEPVLYLRVFSSGGTSTLQRGHVMRQQLDSSGT